MAVCSPNSPGNRAIDSVKLAALVAKIEAHEMFLTQARQKATSQP
jgi:hypothetical protein